MKPSDKLIRKILVRFLEQATPSRANIFTRGNKESHTIPRAPPFIPHILVYLMFDFM